MKTKITSLFVAVILGMIFVSPVGASLLYDNGPINGAIFAWEISSPYWVSDSFVLSSASNLTDAQIGLWVSKGDLPTTVDWSIGPGPNDASLGSGTASLTNAFQGTNQYFDIYESMFPLSATLSAGTYWLTLQNGVTSQNNLMSWVESNGPSQAWESVHGDLSSYGFGSESFQIYSTPSAVPEPSTLLLLGSGMTGLVATRRFRKQ